MDFVAFNNGPGGTLFSRAGNSGSTYAATKTLFDFLLNDSSGNDIPTFTADYKFKATTTNYASLNSNTFEQGGFNGSFSFIYNGASPFTINGITYSGPVNLLSGTFSNALLVGITNGTTGGVFDTAKANLNIHDIEFSSDVITFPNNVEKDFSLGLAAVNPKFTLTGTGNTADLKSFTGTSTGTFSSDPEPSVNGAVPEMATWAMMVMGFGLIGGTIRSRRTGVANLPLARQPEYAL